VIIRSEMENESLSCDRPGWLVEGVGGVLERVGDVPLLEPVGWASAWHDAAGSGRLKHLRFGPNPIAVGFPGVLHAALVVVAGIAEDLPALIEALAGVSAGPPGSGAPAPGLEEPAPLIPLGCDHQEWGEGVSVVDRTGRVDSEQLDALLGRAWGTDGHPSTWAASHRRMRERIWLWNAALAARAELRHMGQIVSFRPTLFRRLWQEQLAEFGADSPGPAGGGLRLRPSRVPRYLAAWVLRGAGLGTQSIGYLLAWFGLAEVPASVRDDPVRGRRRLNTDANRALAFWRRLAEAGGGDEDPDAAPRRLLGGFLHSAFDDRVAVPGSLEIHAAALRTSDRRDKDLRRAEATDLRLRLTARVDRQRRDAVAALEQRLIAQLQGGLDSPLGPAASAARFRRTIDDLGRGGAREAAESGSPAIAWDCAAWILDEVPLLEAARRLGAARTRRAPPNDGLVLAPPLAPPAGSGRAEWWPAARVVVLTAGSTEDLTTQLAIRVGHPEWETRPPRPFGRLLLLANAWWHVIQVDRRRWALRQSEGDGVQRWVESVERVVGPRSRGRPPDVASVIAARVLRRAGLSLSQVGTGLVLLDRHRRPGRLRRAALAAQELQSGAILPREAAERRAVERRRFSSLAASRLRLLAPADVHGLLSGLSEVGGLPGAWRASDYGQGVSP